MRRVVHSRHNPIFLFRRLMVSRREACPIFRKLNIDRAGKTRSQIRRIVVGWWQRCRYLGRPRRRPEGVVRYRSHGKGEDNWAGCIVLEGWGRVGAAMRGKAPRPWIDPSGNLLSLLAVISPPAIAKARISAAKASLTAVF